MGRTSSASELFKDWGERRPGCRPRRGTRQAAGAKGLSGKVPPSWEGDSRTSPPPAAPAWATLARCSAHPVLLAGSQETPGLGGRLPLGAKPHGHRAIYLEVSPPRPLPPLQEKRTLRTPASSLPPTRFAEEGDPHPPWYQGTAACCPFPQPPQVIFLLKLPSRVAWGPGPFLPPLPVLFMFFSHMEVGFPRGAGQCSPAQSVTQRGFRLEPVCSVGSASLVPRPH